MKNFYLAVVLAIMLPFSIFAKTFEIPQDISKQTHSLELPHDLTIKYDEIVDVKVGDFPAPQMAFNVFIDIYEYFWSTMYMGVNPVAYEPHSGTLIYAATSRESIEDVAHSHLDFYFSKDNGRNWAMERVYTAKDSLLFFPSIAVLNPTKSSDPIDFKYVVAVTPFLPEVDPVHGRLFRARGNMYFYFYGGGWDMSEVQGEDFPVGNNSGGAQRWGLSSQNIFGVSSAKGDHFYIYGTLSPLNDGIQYGAYGLAYIDFTDIADPNSQIPREWALSEFRPSTQPTSSFNAPMRMGADPEVNVYAFFYNMFPDNENERIISFTKSTDNGRTWSGHQRMPAGPITDYLQINNHNMSFHHYEYPYSTWDAVVTGVDEFSVFQKFVIRDGAVFETADAVGHLVEISYRNGNWLPIRKVGEFAVETSARLFPPFRLRFDDSPAPNWRDELVENPRWQEIQAALTADGKGIVVKWLTYPSDFNIGTLATPVQLHNNFMATITEMAVPDIFVSTRNVDANQWNVYNITQDKWYNKGTYIPNRVESFRNIPIFETITNRITNPTNFRAGYPYFLQNVVGDRRLIGDNENPSRTGVVYSVASAIFDATNPTPVRNPAIQRPEGLVGTSVLEQLPFSLKDISPNPANDVAYITFSLDNTSDVIIDIHNSMGQTLQTYNVSNAQNGENTVMVNTSNLPAGAYFYTITVNGKKQTKLLNVVR